jgi:prolyl oligopeptidase
LIVNVLEDVTSQLSRFEHVDGEWLRSDIKTEKLGTIGLVAADDNSNVFFFSYQGFLRPSTLYVANDGGASTEPLFALPEFFDATKQQRWHANTVLSGTAGRL